MSAYIYIEGGAAGVGSKYLNTKCQEAFHKLLSKMGFSGRKPRLVACGSREAVFDRFQIQHASAEKDYVAMWIDSEEPMTNTEAAWQHLFSVKSVPAWDRPNGALDAQVIFMTTCMETWIIADRETLSAHYGKKLQKSALPPLVGLENRSRGEMQNALEHATRNCGNTYKKGKRSFDILGELSADNLIEHLPSFARARRILDDNL